MFPRLPVAPVMIPPLQVTPLKAQNLLATVFAVTSVSRRGNSSTRPHTTAHNNIQQQYTAVLYGTHM